MELRVRRDSSAPRARLFELLEARATLGSGKEADIRLRGSDPRRVDPVHAEIHVGDGRYVLKDLASRHGTFVRGERISQRELVAGDVIDFGRGGYIWRFHPGDLRWLLEAPLRGMRRPGPLSSHTRMLLSRARAMRKRSLLGLAAIGALALAASVGIPLRRVERESRSLRSEVERLRVNVSQTNRSTQALLSEAGRMRERLVGDQRLLAEQLGRAESRALRAASVPGEVLEREGRSVGLISGAYGFIDPPTSKPLRFTEMDEAGRPRVGPDGMVLVSPEGKGPVLRQEYSGTGFVVERGLVLTNRHLVRPWLEEPRDRGLISKGWKPRLFRLTVFFPSLRRPVTLEPGRFSRDVDLALCRVRGEDARALPPPLSLADDTVSVSLGQTVGAVGFPAGEEGLLARLDPKVLKRVARGKQSPEEILRRVGELGLVKPLATLGHIGDFSEQQIVYDAATTFGGSGSALVDAEGRVIGVASAVMTEFNGSNFAVPVRYARELLREEGGAAGRGDHGKDLSAQRK